MSQKPAKNPAPEVLFSIRLDPSLKALLDSGAPLHGQIRKQIAEKLIALLEVLGVPGKVAVTVDSFDEERVATGKFLGIYVNGKNCLYPNELLRLVHSYVTGAVIDPNMGPKEILEWLDGLSSNRSRNAKAGLASITEFLSLACLEVVSRQPATVLGYEQATAYCASLPSLTEADPSLTWPPNPTWLWPILQGVLNLRISIANKEAVAQMVQHGLKTGRSQQDVIEDLIESLRPDVIEIQVPEEYLRQLTLADVSNERDWFARMRDEGFNNLGIRYPRFHFVTVENLKPNSCAIKINHLTTLPCVVLTPNECVTNGTGNELELLEIDGRLTIDPLTGMPCSIIDLSNKSTAEEGGLVVVNQIWYVVRCLALALRDHGWCFIDRGYVSRELEKLESLFPKLVEAVRASIPLEQITRVLRSLVAEDISIRDLRSILESQLDYAYSIANSATAPNRAWNDDAALTSFVRTGLKCHISHKYTRGQNVLTAYLLDPQIEKMLAADEAIGSREAKTTHLDEGTRNQILAAVQAQIDDFPPTDNIPVIVTTSDVRHRLREIIAKQFPHVAVLAYQEISPHIDLKPI